MTSKGTAVVKRSQLRHATTVKKLRDVASRSWLQKLPLWRCSHSGVINIYVASLTLFQSWKVPERPERSDSSPWTMTQSSQSAKRAQAKSGNSEECRREKRGMVKEVTCRVKYRNRGVWDALSTIWTTEKVCARIMIANWIILNSQIPLVWCVWCAIVGKRFLQLHICGWNLSRHSFENSIACAKCYYCPVTNRIVHGDITLLVSVAQQISTRLG